MYNYLYLLSRVIIIQNRFPDAADWLESTLIGRYTHFEHLIDDWSIPQLSVRKNCVEEVPQHVDDKINVFFNLTKK